MRRQIIKIDEDLCTGCELCLPNCPEGALQIIDGKARLISDLFCDGLGACLGHCPEGAITVEEREAEPYDERKVMENVMRQGPGVIRAHLEHLQEHGEEEFLAQALACLEEKGLDNPLKEPDKPAMETEQGMGGGCPGARAFGFAAHESKEGAVTPGDEVGQRPSQLTQWPIQMHLISPRAPQFHGRDLLLAADCVAYALGDFHKDHLQGKALAIACPKLDTNQEIYLEKMLALIDEARVHTITVMIMEVPCCMGLVRLAQQAAAQASRRVPLKLAVVGIRGQLLREDWL